MTIKKITRVQGIDLNEHKKILKEFHKFVELSSVIKDKITIEEETVTREGMELLTDSYSHFKYLLSEIEICIKDYERKKKSLRSIMYKSIRRMNSEVQNRSR